MGVVRFTGLPETGHPHYLWNEQEYIVRMLFQNRIGISVWEADGNVMVSSRAVDSFNFVAHGGADIPVASNIHTGFDSSVTGWIYLRLNGSGVYRETTRPIYSQYLHGWYHPSSGDRAIVFIHGELPVNRRAIVMDSSNSMFEYDTRMPPGNERWSIAHQIITPHDTLFTTFTLEPGVYRFELRGGNGGNGGAGGWARVQGNISGINPVPGGDGGISVAVVYELILHHTAVFQAILGGNGNSGTAGDGRGRFAAGGSGDIPGEFILTGGGGGSSGGDTILRTADGRILAVSRGGAGGGGAPGAVLFPDLRPGRDTFEITGGGGGGAGVPNGGDIGSWTPNNGDEIVGNGGAGGSDPNGGTGGQAVNIGNWAGADVGQNGESIGIGNRRNGGNSPNINNPRWGGSIVQGGQGGIGFIGTSGHFRIRKRVMM